MKLAVELTEVKACSISECAYNHDKQCVARAITIGDHTEPSCETFFSAPRHAQAESEAVVGACKMTDCVHNGDYECQAPDIVVDRILGRAHCVTFSHR